MKLKILISAMGSGEMSQAISFASYAQKKGAKIDFMLIVPEIKSFITPEFANSNVVVISDPTNAKTFIEQSNHDVICFFNSKTFFDSPDFTENPPQRRPKAISLDSNWLFGERLRYITWLDRYFINMPKEVFQLGLKEHGGAYALDEHVKNNIAPIGFIPSYEPLTEEKQQETRKNLNIRADQKIVFSYFGYGVNFNPEVYGKITAIIDQCEKKYGDKVMFLLPNFRPETAQMEMHTNVKLINFPIDVRMYFSLLSASDLVLQHQGMATLEQSICAQKPAMCLIDSSRFSEENKNYFGVELDAFGRAGLAYIRQASTTTNELIQDVERLLFEEDRKRMLAAQNKISNQKGEPKLYEQISALIAGPKD